MSQAITRSVSARDVTAPWLIFFVVLIFLGCDCAGAVDVDVDVCGLVEVGDC